MHIRNNDEVQPGQPLFDIDPQPYRIALERARADLRSVRSSVNAVGGRVEAARASLAAAEASRDMAERDASRLEKLHEEDPGAISVRRLEIAQATRDEARSKVRRGRGRPAQGAGGRRRCAATTTRSCAARVAAVEKAELDLARTARRRAGARHGDRPAHRCRPLRAARCAGDDADRDARPVDQRRPDREQHRPRRPRRRGGDRARRDAGRGAEGPRAQHRRRRRQRPAVAAGHAAGGAEQPRLAAPGAAHPGRGRVRRRRAAAAERRARSAARPKCWSTPATTR